MVDCKTCNEPTFEGEEFCSHSCAVEADIVAGVTNALPAPPALPGFAAPTAPDSAPVAPAGLKFDDGKVPLHLLPFDSLIEIAKVLQFGAKKYAPNNWRKGFVYSRLFRAGIGHMISWWMGQDNDPETGFSHLAHAGCCVVFLLHFTLRGDSCNDDRSEHNA